MNFRILFISACLLVACSEDKAPTQSTNPEPVQDMTPDQAAGFMADAAATAQTVALFYNLYQLGKTAVAVGQQDAFHSFYATSGFSDIRKTTGHDPAVLGSDFIFITDPQNDGQADNWFYQQQLQVKADVRSAYAKGMINCFSWHLREPFHENSFYAADMTDAERAQAFVGLLPGGQFHDWYKGKLDIVADFFLNLKDDEGVPIPVIFRPFHEFDGDWFWWGAAYCSPDQYISLYRFTVEYLRDVRGVHQVLFAFSPDRSYASEQAYLQRYPGDDYVDVLGMDNYGDFTTSGGAVTAGQKLTYLSQMGASRKKIVALTETGFRVTTAIPAIPNWFEQYLYPALRPENSRVSMVMFWNNTADGYYVPDPTGTNTEDFISFTNRPDVLLQHELPDLYHISQ